MTGGSSGIGFSIGHAFVREGMAVTLVARGKARLEEAQQKLDPEGGKVLAVEGDVSKAAAVKNLVRETVEQYGRVDVLVNNAGIMKWGPIQRFKEADWDELIAVNLKGAFLCSQAVFPVMRSQRSGYIINISSMAAKRAKVGYGAYGASKGGMTALTETLLEEGLSYSIRATTIYPAYVDTPLQAGSRPPVSEMIKVDDVVATVLYLLRLSECAVVREITVGNKWVRNHDLDEWPRETRKGQQRMPSERASSVAEPQTR